MVPAKRRVVRTILTSFAVALFAAVLLAQSAIEVYPGPGVNTYQSNLYTVEVFNGTAWVPSYFGVCP